MLLLSEGLRLRNVRGERALWALAHFERNGDRLTRVELLLEVVIRDANELLGMEEEILRHTLDFDETESFVRKSGNGTCLHTCCGKITALDSYQVQEAGDKDRQRLSVRHCELMYPP